MATKKGTTKMSLFDEVLAQAGTRDKPKATNVSVKLGRKAHAAIRAASDESGLSMGAVVAGLTNAALTEAGIDVADDTE